VLYKDKDKNNAYETLQNLLADALPEEVPRVPRIPEVPRIPKVPFFE
jgi:hypothetical protein